MKEVLIDFKQYHREMNELDLLRNLVIRFYFGDIDKDMFLKAIRENNDKYGWWC